jgi:hypothetical protein
MNWMLDMDCHPVRIFQIACYSYIDNQEDPYGMTINI